VSRGAPRPRLRRAGLVLATGLAWAAAAVAAQAPAAPDGAGQEGAPPVAVPQSWSPPAHVTPGELPVPAGTRVVRGYADTPLGQVHYQDVGAGPVVVLLHQVPWFYVYYTRAQAEFAARGFRTIAIDTPGYGLSARLPSPPDIAAYATAIEAVLAHLKLPRAVVVGHHTGSTIGVELAKAAPRRVQCLVLHGVPLYTAAEAKARLEAEHWDQRYRTDGSHLSDRWTYLGGRIAGSADSVQWSVLSMFIAGEHEWYGHHAVFRYDMAGALAALRVPVVVLNNDLDLLGYTVPRVRALRPDFTIVDLPSRSSNMAFDEPKEWVDAILGGGAGACGLRSNR
jgi:pimeloyl-ACP methyl ester carboxylesterase